MHKALWWVHGPGNSEYEPVECWLHSVEVGQLNSSSRAVIAVPVMDRDLNGELKPTNLLRLKVVNMDYVRLVRRLPVSLEDD